MALRKGTKASRDSVPPPLHELESEVMEELWRSGESSVRSVMDALNRVAPKQRAYTTYMTIMARLHKKGLLSRRRDGKTDYYAPQVRLYADFWSRLTDAPARGGLFFVDGAVERWVD